MIEVAHSTHIRSVEISVRQLSTTSLTYEITIIAYRDTGSDIQFGGGVLFVGSDEIQGFDVEPEIDLGDEIGFNRIKVEYTFPGPGVYTVGYREENRNEGILNMFNSVETPFYIETEFLVDPSNVFNDSPVLSVPPVDRGTVGEVFIHNIGAYDPDRDSLAYRLGIPRKSADSTVVDYVDPNDPQFYENFAQGNASGDGFPEFFVANTFTDGYSPGDVIWNAPGQEGEYNIAIIIEEWRFIDNQWVNLGFVTRDMQIIIEEGINSPPDLTLPADLCVEAGTNIQQTITASDPDGDDVLIEGFGLPFDLNTNPASLNPMPNIFNQPFQSSPGSTLFQWQTDCNHIRLDPYIIRLKVSDAPDPSNGPTLAYFKSWSIQVIAPAPSLTSTTVNQESVQLAWEAEQCSQLNSYQIWRSQACEGQVDVIDFELIDVVDATTFQYEDVSVDDPNDYCYRIFSEIGDSRNFISAADCIVALNQPQAPTDLAFEADTSGGLELSWVDNSNNELSFVIEKSLDNANNFVVLDEVGRNTSQYTDNVGSSDRFFYRVAAKNASDMSAYSEVVSNVIVSIESDVHEDINLYPNPTRDKIWFDLPTGKRIVNLKVSDFAGISRDLNFTTSNNGQSEIDLSSLSDGIYLLLIDFEGLTINRRIIINR